MRIRTALTPLLSTRREMDRLFENLFDVPTSATATFVPAVDVRETAKEFVFTFDLPGIPEDKVEVTHDNGVLTVRGERETTRREGEQDRYLFVERSLGAFRRVFQLPNNIDESRIEAKLAHGVLTITVPKAKVPEPKKIPLQTMATTAN